MTTSDTITVSDLEARIPEIIERIRSEKRFGTASAAKRGRNPRFPYVPIVKADRGLSQTQQIMGLAYATRDEAVAASQRHIDALYAKVQDDLAKPNMRAVREHYGLPREVAR